MPSCLPLVQSCTTNNDFLWHIRIDSNTHHFPFCHNTIGECQPLMKRQLTDIDSFSLLMTLVTKIKNNDAVWNQGLQQEVIIDYENLEQCRTTLLFLKSWDSESVMSKWISAKMSSTKLKLHAWVWRPQRHPTGNWIHYTVDVDPINKYHRGQQIN